MSGGIAPRGAFDLVARRKPQVIDGEVSGKNGARPVSWAGQEWRRSDSTGTTELNRRIDIEKVYRVGRARAPLRRAPKYGV